MSVRALRHQIGAEILKAMENAGDLPLPNIHRLSRVMQEYFDEGGYKEELEEQGYRWCPTPGYWVNAMPGIIEALKQERIYFGYDREWGEFKGQWCFMSKPLYQRKLRREAADISTRVERYNTDLEDGNKRWSLNLPVFDTPPLLPPVRH
jgi:hypothetical protein